SPSLLPADPGSTLFPYTTLFRSFERLVLFDRRQHILPTDAGQSEVQQDQVRPRRLRILSFLPQELQRVLAGLQPRHAVLNLSLGDRKSTRLNSSHVSISYAVFCL